MEAVKEVQVRQLVVNAKESSWTVCKDVQEDVTER